MFRTASVLMMMGCCSFLANAGDDVPPCTFTPGNPCDVLPPTGPQCPEGYDLCCFTGCNGQPCERCLPKGSPCPPLQPCPVGGNGCIGSDPYYVCGCETTLPACWICTQFLSSCPTPPKVGSVIKFGLVTLATCGDTGYNWTICQGFADILDGDDGPILTVRATGAGTLTVRGMVHGPGCMGPYQISETITIADSCIPDITGNNTVDVDDLLEVINNWGNPGCGGAACCPADLDLDGDVDVDDQLTVLNNWGPCP
jgi:hypothetical protein